MNLCPRLFLVRDDDTNCFHHNEPCHIQLHVEELFVTGGFDHSNFHLSARMSSYANDDTLTQY